MEEEQALFFKEELMPAIRTNATSRREQSGLGLSMFTVNRLFSSGNI